MGRSFRVGNTSIDISSAWPDPNHVALISGYDISLEKSPAVVILRLTASLSARTKNSVDQTNYGAPVPLPETVIRGYLNMAIDPFFG